MDRAELVPAPGERRFYEFGEFRVDPVRRRLLRCGEPIAVTSKSFSLLVVLLERRGEVVEKEELFRRVWPDTYVTEANLTQNVSSLRKALGERAGDGLYIVTVPGRGYSFIADVREVSLDSSGVFPMIRLEPPPAPAPAVLPFPAATGRPGGAEEPESPETRSDGIRRLDEIRPEPAARPWWRRRPGVSLLAGMLLLALAVVSLSLWRSAALSPQGKPPQEPAPAAASRRPAVAVLECKDLGAGPDTAWLGVALSEMLTTELSAGGQARLISGDNVTRTRQSLSMPDTQNLQEPDLVRLRTILGADLVVVGSYLVLDQPGGRQLRLDLRVLELPAGTVLATLSEVGKESDLFEIVARAGTRLRQTLGLDELSPGQTQAVQALHPSVP
jgi:DNA-binding winged helix-turn-helix (wHTH) protein/TolB-like protein